MMPFLLPMLAPLAVLAVQDWRTRTVGAAWLVLLFAAAFAGSACADGVRAAATNLGFNLALLALTGAVLLAYSRIRGKRLRDMLGAGDALFFAALAPAFPPEGYLRASVAMLLCALALWLVLRRRLPSRAIPLVSLCGAPLSLMIILLSFDALPWIS